MHWTGKGFFLFLFLFFGGGGGGKNAKYKFLNRAAITQYGMAIPFSIVIHLEICFNISHGIFYKTL